MAIPDERVLIIIWKEAIVLIAKDTKIIKISTYRRMRQMKRRKMWVSENLGRLIIIVYIVGLFFVIGFSIYEVVLGIRNPHWTTYRQSYPYPDLYPVP